MRHEKSGYRADTANLGRKAPQMEYIFRRCKTSFYAILLQIRAHGSSAWHRSTSPGVRPCGAAACNDMTTMAAASFAEVWFVGLSNTVAPPAFFFGIMCFHSLWRPILHWQRLVLRKLAAASCFAWDVLLRTQGCCCNYQCGLVQRQKRPVWMACTPFYWHWHASGTYASPGGLACLTAREAAGEQRAGRGDVRSKRQRDA